jgi:ectoine hydroxylase-related dioxygenase (phytanoyl-CoA dioxygenase family)
MASNEWPGDDGGMVTIAVTEADRALFQARGFVVKPRVLAADFIEELRERFPRLFRGEFDTGVYPDEWYWREEISRPEATRHMANAWKADLTVARLVLAEELARAAGALSGWDEVKLGQDTIWWKPPQTKSIGYHQDTSFMEFLEPTQTTTCWVALDDTSREAGTLEYAMGSHRWPVTPIPKEFHATDDYRAPMRAAAGGTEPEIAYVEVPAGSCVFHAGEIWHGSGPNRTGDRMRRSIGIHYLPGHVQFSERPGGYIYRRYQKTGEATLDESYFPVVSSGRGRRTAWIDGYRQTGLRK